MSVLKVHPPDPKLGLAASTLRPRSCCRPPSSLHSSSALLRSQASCSFDVIARALLHHVSTDTAATACLLPTFSLIPPRPSTLTQMCICHVLPGRPLKTASCTARAPATPLQLLRLRGGVQMVQTCRFINRLSFNPCLHSPPSLLQRLLTRL
jgi:hypothetical protein